MSDGHGGAGAPDELVPVRLPRYAGEGLWDSLCGGVSWEERRAGAAPRQEPPGARARARGDEGLRQLHARGPGESGRLGAGDEAVGHGVWQPRVGNDPICSGEGNPDELVRIRSWILGGAPKN